MGFRKYTHFIDGKFEESGPVREITNPFTGIKVAEACQADELQMKKAIASASSAFVNFRHSSSFMRCKLLLSISHGLAARKDEMVEALVSEAGKPKTLAEIEVSRAIQTFTIAAEESKRLRGELIPLDLDSAGRAYYPAASFFIPRGPVLAITPFNFPINLIAHKVAPALAVGATVLLKPPPQAPGAAMILAQIFARGAAEVSDSQEQVPFSALQVIHAPNDVVALAVTDPRISTLSFTGSDRVGWAIQKVAVGKKLCLELGGNAAVLVHSDGDLKRAAARCAFGAFAYAGQICISVQRIWVQKSVAKEFQEYFLNEVKKLKEGDPTLADTVVGPLIDNAASTRIEEWIQEARQGGATLLAGGKKTGSVISPTVLTNTQATHKVRCEEAFGPVVTLETYETVEEAIGWVNQSRFGLQAGIFSDSASTVAKLIQGLEVGGVIVNDIPTYRADHMPYGGVKDSGLGREGVRYAMEEYCERKTVVTWKG